MTILVTGGAGYIGSHTVRQLRSEGRDVIVLDSLERGNRDALLGAPFVQGDISDSALVAEVCRKHEVQSVIHFAAYKSVGESMIDPAKYWRNNVQGTVDLLEGMLKADVHQIVFSSSAAVYGNPDSLPIREDAPLRPENVYAETKAVMERVIHWYGQTHGVRWVSLRYFNAAGASSDGVLGENWDMSTNLVPLVMKAALGASGPVKVFGNDYPTPDGTGVRDYIHVEDLAIAHAKAVDHLTAGRDNVTLNLGTGRGVSVMEIIRETESALGRPVPYEVVGRRPGDPATVYADPSQAHLVLRWTSSLDMSKIIASAANWHQSRMRE
ncbi:MAG: UDP-glucose 4-epimerase GalE [Actinobacteria bacterium]|nr:UDP-glucose 4-epimerase GalE [Actinomycetota bacterium]